MTEPIRVIEPQTLTQGESTQWERYFCDYPATLWTLEYRFRGPGTGFNVTATADGQKFAAAITSTETTDLATGKYEWQAWATNIADMSVVRKIGEGVTIVERGFTTSQTGTVDLRTTAKKILDAIDAALLVDATSNVISYEITTPAGTRKVQKSRNEAIALRKYYAEIVERENVAERVRNGGKFARTIVARMRTR
jgi:hypothetical protein